MRLVTFGCSLTYGDSLIDNKLAWPYLTAKHLNIHCDNQAQRGISNHKILYNILNYKFNVDDIVVIMWTYVTREMRLQIDGTSELFGPWDKGGIERPWVEFAEPYDYSVKTLINIHHAKLHLNSLNMRHIHFKADNSTELPIAMDKCTFIDNVFDLDVSKVDPVDYGLDNSHPGPKTHQLFSLTVSDLIQEKFL